MRSVKLPFDKYVLLSGLHSLIRFPFRSVQNSVLYIVLLFAFYGHRNHKYQKMGLFFLNAGCAQQYCAETIQSVFPESKSIYTVSRKYS